MLRSRPVVVVTEWCPSTVCKYIYYVRHSLQKIVCIIAPLRQFDLKDIASSDSSPLIGHFSQGRGDNQHNKYSYTSEFSCIRVAFTERSKANWLMLAWIMWYDAKINRYQYKMMRLPWLVFFIWGQGTIFNTLERSESSRTIFNFLIAIQTFFFNRLRFLSFFILIGKFPRMIC